MNQYIGTLIVLLGLFIIPSAFVQLHVTAQLKQELREIQADAVKKIEAEGNILPANAEGLLRQFVGAEIATKSYRLDQSKLQLSVARVGGISTSELTYKDEFSVTLRYPCPPLISIFSNVKDFRFVMNGTMEPLPYDANP